MKRFLLVMFLVQAWTFAIKIQIEHQDHILDLKNNLFQVSHDIHRLERDYSLTMSKERKLKTLKPIFNNLRNKSAKLYDHVIVSASDYHGMAVNLRTIRGDIQYMADQFTIIMGRYDTKKIFRPRTQRKLEHISYLLDELIFAISDGEMNDEYSMISKYSNDYKERTIKYIVQGEYEEFYRQVLTNIENVDSFKSALKKQRRRNRRAKNHIKYKRNLKLHDIINRVSSIEDSLEKLESEIIEGLKSEENLNREFIKESLLNINQQLNSLIDAFNQYEKSDLELKHLLSQLKKGFDKSLVLLNIRIKESLEREINGLKEIVFEYENEQDVCETVSSPGHILLQKSKSNRTSLFTEFGQGTSRGIQLLELLKFEDTDIDYSHAELITEINGKHDIQTWSYYPWMFNRNKQETEHRPPFVHVYKGWRWCSVYTDEDGQEFRDCKNYNKSYRSNYSVFNVKASNLNKELERKEKALKKVEQRENFFRKGLAVCSDFINWAFDNVITSNWNFIPGVKQLVQMIYIPEGWQTPDNLADSYMTEKVCEVKDDEIIYPKEISLHRLVEKIRNNMNSEDSRISSHAKRIYKKLIDKKILSRDGSLRGDILVFEEKKEDLLDW